MRALVTGASGLVGSQIVRALLEAGVETRVLVRTSSNVEHLAGLSVQVAYGDVLVPDSLVDVAQGCDFLFHAAAVFDYGVGRAELEKTAVAGTINLLRAAKHSNVKRFVLTSTSAVQGFVDEPYSGLWSYMQAPHDENDYLASKFAQEAAALFSAQELGLELIVVAPTITVGPFESRLGPSNAIVIAYLSDPMKMTYPGGINVVASDDCGVGHVLAANKGVPGKRYIVGGENVEWHQVHRILSELAGVQGPLINASHTACMLASIFEEGRAKIEGRFPVVSRVQSRMVGRYYWYRSEELGALGYRPKPAMQALAGSLSWLSPTSFMPRETRQNIRLGPQVYEIRRATARRERALRNHDGPF